MVTQGRRPLPPGDDDLAQELKLHLQTLHDLGPSYSDEVAEAFIRHIDQRIDQRLERRLAQMSAQRGHDTGAIVWILVLAIPITAIVGGIAGLPGIVVVWAAILMLVWRMTK